MDTWSDIWGSILFLALLFAALGLYAWYRDRPKRNRIVGLPRPLADSRSSIQQFNRIVGNK